MAETLSASPRDRGEVVGVSLGIAGEPGWLSPVRQFYISLGIACLVGALVISLSISFLLQRFIFDETRDLTAAGVELHFRSAFGGDIFRRSLSAEEFKNLDQMVRSHFNIYDIVQVKFYGLDGRITYSYRPDLVGSFSPEGQISDKLRRALGGEVVMGQGESSRADNDRGRDFSEVFEIYVPVRDGAQVIGVAEVYRNAERLLMSVRFMQGFVAVTVFFVSLVLFLTLRQTYDSSTKRIATQSKALREALREVRSTYDRTLETLSVALDARDAETEGHSRRVMEFALTIAKQMGLVGPDLDDLARGALLHDIGKMMVSDAILRKPGPLTADEWVEMRQHPDFGHRMLAPIGFLRRSLPLIQCHHERWDGSGYQAGISGEQIPMAARIFAVADALDAITSNRPYREGRSFAEAREEIFRHKASQFDPRVVEAFAAIPPDVYAAIEREMAAKRRSVWGVPADSTAPVVAGAAQPGNQHPQEAREG